MTCLQAGAFAGISVNLLTFPLDTLKTRLQSPSFRNLHGNATNLANRALWRKPYQGVGTVMLVAVPSSGVFFMTYESMKYLLGGSSSLEARVTLPQSAVHALSSSIAQLVNCAVLAPAEVLKQNAQMVNAHHNAASGSPSPIMSVLRRLRQHPSKLWSGYTALVARDLPFTALHFPAFEKLKEMLLKRQIRLREGDGTSIGIMKQASIAAVSAGVAGGAAAWVTTPFDVIKTQMMLQAGTQDLTQAQLGSRRQVSEAQSRHGKSASRRGGYQIGKAVLEREGLRGMFRGGLVRGMFTVVGNGLFMGCYEFAKLYLQKY